MANSPQSIKRIRQSETKRKINQGLRTKFRTMVKRARAATPDTAKAAFAEMQAVTDRAARRGIIHVNQAARLKTRINRMLRALGEAGAVAAVTAKVAKVAKPAKAAKSAKKS